MASRFTPVLLAIGVGVGTGIYIWQAPLQELTGQNPNPSAINEGRSQSVKDGNQKDGPSAQPHAALRYGGSQPSDPEKPSIAGASAQARKSNSADHDVKTRENPNVHDGTSGGGVGVAEMRERKMKGMGLPSPQGGDTKAQPVEATKDQGEGGGLPKKGKWWLGGW